MVLKGSGSASPAALCGGPRCALLLQGGGQAQAGEGPPPRSLPSGEGTALLFPQERQAQETHNVPVTWSAVEQKSGLPVPEARGFRPSPAQQRLALCVASMYLDSEKSEADSRPCSVCGPGTWFPREAEEVPLDRAPTPHHEATCCQVDRFKVSHRGWEQREFSSKNLSVMLFGL